MVFEGQNRGLRIRQGYSLLYIGLYVILAPLLLLYAYGYRYDFDTGRIVRTGVLSVASVPDHARVSIDGNESEKTTPAFFRSLLPRTYTIRLDLDGLQSWEQHVSVTPNAATIVDALLYYTEPIVIPLPVNTIVASSPADARPVYAVAGESTWAIVDVSGTTIGTVSFPPVAIVPSPFSEDIAVLGSDRIGILHPADGSATTVLGTPADAVWVDARRIAVLRTDGVLDSIERDGSAATQDREHVWLGLARDGSHIMGISDDNGIVVSSLELGTAINLTELAHLPDLSSPVLTAYPGQRIVVADRATRETYLVTPDRITDLGATGPWSSWSDRQNALLLYNDTELGVWSAETEQYTLLNRTSDLIGSAHWLGRQSAILLNQQSGVSALTYSDDRTVNATPLLPTPLDRLTVDENGKLLTGISDGQAWTIRIRP